MSETESTRRDALRTGLFATGAIAAATIAPAALGAARAFGEADTKTASGDAGILEGVLDAEQTALVAYETIAKNGLFGASGSIATEFAKQEQEHIDALTKAVKAAGGTAPNPPLPSDIPGFTQIAGPQQALAFAVALENQTVAHYVDGVNNLESQSLMTAFAQIMPCEGQQLVVLRQALGTDPMPAALPTGSEKN